jgi:hypothetical protein
LKCAAPVGAGEDHSVGILFQIVDWNVRQPSAEGLPALPSVGAVEDADVSSRIDAVAAGIATAASAQIGRIDQDLEHWNVGQTVRICYDLAS